MINLLNAEFPEIVNQIRNEKNKRKETEENLRKQAEEKARQEAEIEAQKQQAKAVIVEEVSLPNMETINADTVKTAETYITIKVSGLTKEATTDLLNVIKKHNLKYTKEVK